MAVTIVRSFGFLLLLLSCIGIASMARAAGCPDGPYAQGVTGPPILVGAWEAPVAFSYEPLHAVMLKTGKVLTWSTTTIRQWDPSSGTLSVIGIASQSLFCSGHNHAADGRVYVIGGGPNNNPFAHTWIVDPDTPALTQAANMAAPRWYPTLIALSDGRLAAFAGHTAAAMNDASDTPELYSPASATWEPQDQLTRTLELEDYAKVFELPSPPGQMLHLSESAAIGASMFTFSDGWGQNHPSPLRVGDTASAVYLDGSILTTATSSQNILLPEPGSQLFDGVSSWTQLASPQFPRLLATLVALPNGQVAYMGGIANQTEGSRDASCAIYAPEIYDPEENTWSLGASHQHEHLYHSTALLLPDGRIWLASGGAIPFDPAMEVYRPWYWHAPRVAIESAPASFRYGGTHGVDTDSSAVGKWVTLIRLGAPTHNFDQSQRLVVPASSERAAPESDVLDVTTPSRFEAPPGYYYLSVVDSAGVPSISRIVRIQARSRCGLLGVEALLPVALSLRRRRRMAAGELS